MLKLSAKFLAITAAALMFAGSADATPVTYDLTLTATGGNVLTGTGSFSIDDSQLTGTGNEYFTLGDPSKTLLSIHFDIGGDSFDQTDTIPLYALAYFQNGVLAGITFNAVNDYPYNLVSLNVGALSYVYADKTDGNTSTGTIAITTPSRDPVPEPASLALLGAGLAGLGLRRRKA